MPNAVRVGEDRRLACQGKQPSRLFNSPEALPGLPSRRNASQHRDEFVALI